MRGSIRVYAPQAGSSITLTATSTYNATIRVWRPDFSYYGSFTKTGTIPAGSVTAGIWYFDVGFPSQAGGTTYTIKATLGCANETGSSCDDLSGDPARSTQWVWGDRLAGRLPTSSSYADYTVWLAQTQHAAFSLPHSDPTSCRAHIEVFGPSTMNLFTSKANASQAEWIFDWWDGAAAANPTGTNGNGPGGHIRAPVSGTYTVRVRPTTWAPGCSYRLFVAKESTLGGEAMPAW